MTKKDKLQLQLELETLISLIDKKPFTLIESIEEGMQYLRLYIVYLMFDIEVLRRELLDAKKGDNER